LTFPGDRADIPPTEIPAEHWSATLEFVDDPSNEPAEARVRFLAPDLMRDVVLSGVVAYIMEGPRAVGFIVFD
jgi:hypothetical protein